MVTIEISCGDHRDNVRTRRTVAAWAACVFYIKFLDYQKYAAFQLNTFSKTISLQPLSHISRMTFKCSKKIKVDG